MQTGSQHEVTIRAEQVANDPTRVHRGDKVCFKDEDLKGLTVTFDDARVFGCAGVSVAPGQAASQPLTVQRKVARGAYAYEVVNGVGKVIYNAANLAPTMIIDDD